MRDTLRAITLAIILLSGCRAEPDDASAPAEAPPGQLAAEAQPQTPSQSFRDALQLICDAPNHLKSELSTIPPDKRAMVMGQYLDRVVVHPEARALFESLALGAPEARQTILQSALKKAGLETSTCAIQTRQ